MTISPALPGISLVLLVAAYREVRLTPQDLGGLASGPF